MCIDYLMPPRFLFYWKYEELHHRASLEHRELVEHHEHFEHLTV